MFDFEVVSGSTVRDLLRDSEKDVVAVVESAYLAHDAGATVNPDSYFLRFPDRPSARIIALPAYLGETPPTVAAAPANIAGIKWIASFPDNIEDGRPRASAVLVLNDPETGYPVALLEAAAISAARTAASAALAATVIHPAPVDRIGVVGAGMIARTVLRYLAATGTRVDHVLCHDRDESSATHLSESLRSGGVTGVATQATTAPLTEALDCDIVVFATTAGAPYTEHVFRAGQTILHLSLRDLGPTSLLAADNVFDDVEHCMKADTSAHLTERLTGGRDFVTGTLAGLILGRDHLTPDRPVVFSPFGLGVLDLALGAYLLERARTAGSALDIPDFFGTTERW